MSCAAAAALGLAGLEALRRVHPVFIEGAARADTREAVIVGRNIARQLRLHWERRPPPPGPKVIVIQGDPHAEHGISAITRVISEDLQLPRCLITLDADLDPTHAPNADRLGVTTELSYRTVAASLVPADLDRLSSAIEAALESKRRESEAKGRTIPSYFLKYALLQEVSKAALQRACGRITLAHTASEIYPFSVTSFHRVGTASGFYDEADVVPYGEDEDLVSKSS